MRTRHEIETVLTAEEDKAGGNRVCSLSLVTCAQRAEKD